MEQVVNASKLAKCHDFISKFRSGYNTFAGSKGSMLSGGQRQRVVIARAAMMNPDVLLLDEATSALDSENEKLVNEALENLMRGKTTVVIAHRLSTIIGADHIVCMQKGVVVEQGRHDELMALGGAYYNLINKQLIKEPGEQGNTVVNQE